MNTTLKRGLQILGTVAILGTSACVVDPYYSGVDYGGYDAYNYDNSYTSTTRVIGNGSNFALSTGFLVGNYYYYDDYYSHQLLHLRRHALLPPDFRSPLSRPSRCALPQSESQPTGTMASPPIHTL